MDFCSLLWGPWALGRLGSGTPGLQGPGTPGLQGPGTPGLQGPGTPGLQGPWAPWVPGPLGIFRIRGPIPVPDPRLSGPGAGPAAGPVIRRAKIFRFFSILFFPVRAGPVGSYGRKK